MIEKMVEKISSKIGNQLDGELGALKKVQAEIRDSENQLKALGATLLRYEEEKAKVERLAKTKLLDDAAMDKVLTANLTLPTKIQFVKQQISELERPLSVKRKEAEQASKTLGTKFINILCESSLKRKYDEELGDTLHHLFSLFDSWVGAIKIYAETIDATGVVDGFTGQSFLRTDLSPNYSPLLCEYLLQEQEDMVLHAIAIFEQIKLELLDQKTSDRKALASKVERVEKPGRGKASARQTD
jgi:hypothetical protein